MNVDEMNSLAGRIFELEQKLKQLRIGLNHIIFESNRYVLKKHKAGDENIHNSYRRLCQKIIREVFSE